MTKRQQIAYQDPSARAWDNLEPKFFRFVRIGGTLYSTILSVNK